MDSSTRTQQGCITTARQNKSTPVLQIIGYKNSGKTALSCQLIAALTAKGIRVGSAKHDAHGFELDDEGTDSSRHLGSGAVQTVLTSKTATRMMRPSEVHLEEIAAMMQGTVDIIIAEGFKTAPFPKIALLRDQQDLESLHQQASNIKLFISWQSSLCEEAYRTELDSYGYSDIPIIHIHNEESVLKQSMSLALSLLK
ncbi:molybdopterin-guanine dinucleotide biosynthesis protein B [Paenibacillus dakarensis]|uniref:molybdopterin-guanine dinucleotide biosynthesis protein B n=1 Tax=Paenibacillus dakarensis TaxID=1527293 RepID=UPI0006D5AE5A|nr:molybdopterin-guanine dinucleotide biosynthesis protein B [Paenibacillus dakarensis]